MSDVHPAITRTLDRANAAEEARVRAKELSGLVDRLVLGVIASPGAMERMAKANDELGKWMAAALDCPNVGRAMKRDIEEWFYAQEYLDLMLNIRALLLEARYQISQCTPLNLAPRKRGKKGKRNARRKA